MTLGPRTRKVALTAHVTTSVGWLGAVIASLALAVAGLASTDPQVVRSVYVALEVMGWWALVPLSACSLLTGLIQGLGTPWGLLRHYWVLLKLLMNLFASGVLLLYMRQLDHLAGAVLVSDREVLGLRDPSPVVHAGAAMALLLVAATLSVFKPRGMTRYGQRKQLTR